MPDYVLVLCFFSMLLVPCFIAFQTTRNDKEGSVPELSAVSTGSYFGNDAEFPPPTRAELTAKRNRELYLRSLGKLDGDRAG